MSSTSIRHLRARQILDSRGRPTIECELTLQGGVCAVASVPSGASTGRFEAVELRDGGGTWEGLGVGRAIESVGSTIAPALLGFEVSRQSELDHLLRELDGTSNLGRLGGNAILAVSLAAIRASAAAMERPLYRRIADLAGVEPVLPLPMVNILSGGLHARRAMDLQDFLVVPIGAGSYRQALEWSCQVRLEAQRLCDAHGHGSLLADEGGLAPSFARAEVALDFLMEAICRAGLEPGAQVSIALDIAATSLLDGEGVYVLPRQGLRLDAMGMIDLLAEWASAYPIVSIEDGLGEEDWGNWEALTRSLSGIQVLGDDLFATQASRIEHGVQRGVANCALIKVNQNGTFTGAIEAAASARRAGYALVASARSGETEDAFLADFSVGLAAKQIKVGSVRNAERMTKYNQLLRIEEDGAPWPGRTGLAPL